MLLNLHLLRVIAALGVVYFHITSEAGLGLSWNIGSRGVDLFFVISGFIIAYVGTTNPHQFFRRRLIRVVPFYWAASLCVFAMVIVAPELFRTMTASVPHLVASLLFIPHEFKGEMLPTLQLGWSLNFEMFFYTVCAVALWISPTWSPVISAGAIVTFVAVVHGLGVTNAIAAFYARPIVLEFCYGIAVFYLFSWCSARRERVADRPALKWGLVAMCVGSLIALGLLEQYDADTLPRYIAAGIPAFLIVAGAVLLDRIYGLATKNRLIYLLGESSYILYLVHPYVIYGVLRVLLTHASALSTPLILALIVGLMALTSAIAIALHVWFERPVMAYLRARLTAQPGQAVRRDAVLVRL